MDRIMTHLTKVFQEHVRKLETIALGDGDKDRKEDAVRSLAAMALLVGGWKPE